MTLIVLVFVLLSAAALPAVAGGASAPRSPGDSAESAVTPDVEEEAERPDEAERRIELEQRLPPANPPGAANRRDVAEDADWIDSLRPPIDDTPAAAPALARPATSIVFPVLGHATFGDTFGAPRDGGARLHEGVDVFAPKMTPVVAVAAGTVTFLRANVGSDCCLIRLLHDDGRSSLYIHLNNDTPGTDDGLGYGIAEGIVLGARVEAGQVIGYVGDSGNAEDTPPHLHFEYRDVNNVPTDPFPILVAAKEGTPVAFAPPVEGLPYTGFDLSAAFAAAFVAIAVGVVLLSHTNLPDAPVPEHS